MVGFFVNALAPLTDVLEPWQPLSPHYHYLGYDPLTRGLDFGHAAVLAVTANGLAAPPGGRITGTLSDPSGAVVQGGRITATNVESGLTRTAVSDRPA